MIVSAGGQKGHDHEHFFLAAGLPVARTRRSDTPSSAPQSVASAPSSALPLVLAAMACDALLSFALVIDAV
jgi:hypothetical protein